MSRSSPPAHGARTRVLIADDHELVRKGLRKVLELDHAIEFAGEAATAAEVLDELSRNAVDLLLLDLRMPGCHDVDLVQRIRQAHPGLPVLILTMQADPLTARRALDAGALGFLTKDISTLLLLEAVHRVAAGHRYVDPSLGMPVLLAQAAPPAPAAQLSTRERQVLIALVHGKTLVDIAAELKLAANTISTYKARLMEKLGQGSLSELVRYALRHGLVD